MSNKIGPQKEPSSIARVRAQNRQILKRIEENEDLQTLKDTHSLWNKQISRILCRAYEDRVINSEQLHILTSKFYPTQDHEVYETT